MHDLFMPSKDGDSMKVGFIGAGKMGFTFGKHLCLQSKLELVGYYSRHLESAKAAAEFTDTKYYESLEELVFDADALFLTVPDGQISVMVEQLDRLGAVMDGKILIHTSGALSSRVFSGISYPIYGYSIHPIYAVNSKLTSYKHFGECFITMEGHAKYLEMFQSLFENLGHKTKVISAEDKTKYHSSAVFASNLVVGLYQMASELLSQCGFTQTEAKDALSTLFYNNAKNILAYGTKKALTGPVARGDIETVSEHMKVLSGNYLNAYKAISDCLIEIAKQQKADEENTEVQEIDVYGQLHSLFQINGRNAL